MPRIEPIVAQTNPTTGVSGPRANADTFGGGVARAIEGAGKTIMGIGDMVQKRAEQDDVSSMTAKLAEAHADLAKEWDETIATADPNDKEVADRFKERVKDRLESVGASAETYSGKLHYQQSAAKIGEHFVEKAHAGQAQLAGLKAVDDYKRELGARTSGLLVDPAAYQMMLDENDASLNSKIGVGGIDRATAIKLRSESRRDITRAAIQGEITTSSNPDVVRQKLDQGIFDKEIDGDTKLQMYGAVEREVRARDVFAKQREAEAEKALKLSQERTQQGLLAGIEYGGVTKRDIMESNLNAVGGGSKEHFLKLLDDKINGVNIKTDPAIVQDLMLKLANPSTRDEIFKKDFVKEYGDKMDRSDLMKYMNVVSTARQNDLKTLNRLDGFRTNTKIVHDSLEKAGITGKPEVAEFNMAADAEFMAFEKQYGKAPDNAEVQRITDRLLMPVLTKKSFLGIPYNGTSPKYKVPIGQDFDIEVKDIPKAERAAIEAALKRAGKAATEDQIKTIYKIKGSR